MKTHVHTKTCAQAFTALRCLQRRKRERVHVSVKCWVAEQNRNCWHYIMDELWKHDATERRYTVPPTHTTGLESRPVAAWGWGRSTAGLSIHGHEGAFWGTEPRWWPHNPRDWLKLVEHLQRADFTVQLQEWKLTSIKLQRNEDVLPQILLRETIIWPSIYHKSTRTGKRTVVFRKITWFLSYTILLLQELHSSVMCASQCFLSRMVGSPEPWAAGQAMCSRFLSGNTTLVVL